MPTPALSPPSYSTKPASGEVRLDHTPRYPPFRSFSTPSLPSSQSSASPWPSYSNYPPSAGSYTSHYSPPLQPSPYDPFPLSPPTTQAQVQQPISPSLHRSATDSTTSHSPQDRGSRHRGWRSRRNGTVGLEDVFFEGGEASVSDERSGAASTTFVLPSYRPGEDQEPMPRERRRKKVGRALRRMKRALCVDCGGFAEGRWQERSLVGAAAGATVAAVGVAAWALCG